MINSKKPHGSLSLGQVVGSWRENDKLYHHQEGPAWLFAFQQGLCLAATADSKQLLIATVGSARPRKYVHDSSAKYSLHSYGLCFCSRGSVQGGFVPPLA